MAELFNKSGTGLQSQKTDIEQKEKIDVTSESYNDQMQNGLNSVGYCLPS